jgi:hypothetical protein
MCTAGRQHPPREFIASENVFLFQIGKLRQQILYLSPLAKYSSSVSTG